MKRQDCTIRHLLLSYVSLLAERESYGPGDGFEYVLWDDLMRPHSIGFSGRPMSLRCRELLKP
jgi:hypothetical protein